MNVMCAWCGCSIQSGSPAGPISHGICGDCGAAFETTRQPIAQFLESLDGPVLLVDAEGRAVGGNLALTNVVQREASWLAGRLGGEILSCVYATLPGGCGRTAHCPGCTIRRAVTDTRTTGESSTGVSAFADVNGPDGPLRLSLSLTLERMGREAVLLRIDRVHPADAAAPASTPPRSGALTVLVADDDDGVRRLLSRALRSAGFQVLEAADGRDATRAALAGPVDVVITDLVMPQQEGIETVRELRRSRPDLGIIAISGAFSGLMLNAARLLGADATLPKPVRLDELVQTVRRVSSLRGNPAPQRPAFDA